MEQLRNQLQKNSRSIVSFTKLNMKSLNTSEQQDTSVLESGGMLAQAQNLDLVALNKSFTPVFSSVKEG